MFLKQINMSGFKSFADRVELAFGPGVTCIVGPNGCGKSNVVDSFKWVLGEQSAKSLRGRQMMDMIFNGSSTRKSSSVAQVDLTFDNTDRALAIDANEVVVSRKLYRSGESEYLLNKEPARLKDVRELFMDTGVGTEAYSVIEQGRVERLLQSSPIERRTIFEEAAGVSRYKARRKEAERKLERTQQNLLRLADIVEEVEKRLRSVKLAAGKARNFQEYDRRVRELQSSKSMADYHRLTEAMGELNAECAGTRQGIAAINARILAHEAREVELNGEDDHLGDQIAAADGDLLRTQSNISAQEERIAGATRRIAELEATLERAVERHRVDTERLAAQHRELADAETSITALQAEAEDLHTRVDAELTADQESARELTRLQAALDDEKAGIVDLLRRTARTHNEILSLNTHRESLLNQKGKLATRHQQIAAELEDAVGRRAQLSRRLREIEALIAAEQERLEEKKAEADRIDHVRSDLVDHLARAKEDRSAMLSRREVLRDLDIKMEGVGQGARQLLEARQREEGPGPLRQIRGLVADFFEADVQHARIVEAALGEFDQYLVVDDAEAFLAEPARFAGLPGRVTSLCLHRLPPVINERDFADKPGFVARALDLVRVPPEMDHLARHLLGKTVIVATLADALVLAREDVYGHRFVTREGEVVEPDGRVRLGPPATAAGLITRKSELRDLQSRLEQADRAIEMLTDQLNRTQAEAGQIHDVQQQLRASIHEAQTSAVEARAGVQNIEESIRRLSGEQPLIAGEIAVLENQIDDALARNAERREQMEAMERENVERESRVDDIQRCIDAVVEKRQASQERLTQLRVQIGQVGEKRRTAAERIAALRKAIREVEDAVAQSAQDIDQCHTRLAEARHVVVEATQTVEALRLTLTQLEATAAELRGRREQVRSELTGMSDAVHAARAELHQTEDRLHELEMSLAQSNVRRDELIARTLAELNVNLAEMYAQYAHQEQDWEAVETEIAELRRKIERLGNVNLDAIAELEELEQRYGFLTGQRDDLSASIRELEELITRLNAESSERFRTTFEQVRDQFRALFRKLFGGGRADIILENPDDVLESGIEIVAQPPGKELQSISLMSGGEKSMTAIAMMMSIFKCRPSPFAILDEVDAALDEANNVRFNRIVQEFVEQSQFIVITHSKRTMGIGDRLYGITMQEPGVSTLVSVKLEQAAGAA